MKITKSQLKEVIKQELKKVLAEQEETRAITPKPTYTEDIPEWYKGEGGVADQINQLRDGLFGEIDELKARVKALEPKPEPMNGRAAVATGGTPKP